ncbi:hypothetical protein ACVMGF_002998 [Bradyrhizobium diazoefficiens]
MMTGLETPSARAAWMYSKLRPRRELGPHETDQRDPGEQQENAEQHEEAGHEDRGQDQEKIERRNCRPYLDEALEDEIDPAAEITLYRSRRDADDG